MNLWRSETAVGKFGPVNTRRGPAALFLSFLLASSGYAWDGALLSWWRNTETNITNYTLRAGNVSSNWPFVFHTSTKTNCVLLFPWAQPIVNTNPAALWPWTTNGTPIHILPNGNQVWFLTVTATAGAITSDPAPQIIWTNQPAPPEGLRIIQGLGVSLIQLDLGPVNGRTVIEKSTNAIDFRPWLELEPLAADQPRLAIYPRNDTMRAEYFRKATQ